MKSLPAASLTMLGGARTVTGSQFLLEVGRRRVLVECGIFQGLKELRLRNWAPFPVDPSSLDAIVITHAHLDHCGLLPRLVAAGYDGPVYVTPDTASLMGVVLPDSGRLNEDDAEFSNRIGSSRHHPALPLYTEADALSSMKLLEPVEFGTEFEVGGIGMRFDVAGHILGSATLHVRLPDGTTARFSGDLGRPNHPLLRPPEPVGDVDFVIVESTYGDRIHDDADPGEQLEAVVNTTFDRGGILVIPAFAVDRTEVVLIRLARMARQGRLPPEPVFVDSPMALAALRIYRAALEAGRADVRPSLRGDDDLFDVPMLTENEDADGSRRISARRDPAIVIAGAGMAAGGRVVHHLEKFLPDPRNAVALVGFQAVGTRGRALLEGAEVLKMHGRYVPVRAQVCDLSGFSVHADARELRQWVSTATREPDEVIVVHGEPDASQALRRSVAQELGWTAGVPDLGERLLLARRNRGSHHDG